MTTQQAIEALYALPRMGQGKPGLARMQNLMDHLGNPEKELQCIHIAGTNGKGSLAAMTSAILTAAGYKTGLTISPYVVDFRERFQIDGEMIPPRTLASLTQKVMDAADAIEAEGGEKPVEFEAVTALALLWFAREKCDLVVLETGLGGRCDATNIVPRKLVAAITKIGYDHMEVLGDTLDKIAAEKAGIIKEGAVVVNYPDQPAEAMGPILTAAAEAHTSIITPDKDDLTLLRGKRLENRIDYGGYRAALGLPGTHQANHAAMAVEIALALWREFGYDISDDAILQGLADARMPARIEVLRRHPLLLLDGCHNPDGAKMLAATLTRADFEENLVGVLGVLADKDYKEMLSDLAPCFAKVYTVTPNCPRALSAEDLQKEARFHMDAEVADNVPDALRKAIDYADENNLAGVVVCGSLYLAAEARPWLLKEAEK
ncbi:MAG: folylpolyglutamate synthase/dihydrofolate synthase family protein [Gemmiger sp.]|uniref:bifunctional folylpolyglutamate synthase/dihydrofolate synthase n=1 Tax=Gemmiger sp. TaxID=2049027 RepID=UPI002E76E45F|nr:folylpolyglutamate synthase/dihydrofolate synthase family protein [Gemmiger sp.]MEE0098168.1 folylpolyglutamate synthase/dihydrofolate synthase family protein [Gemmiger sp.]